MTNPHENPHIRRTLSSTTPEAAISGRVFESIWVKFKVLHFTSIMLYVSSVTARGRKLIMIGTKFDASELLLQFDVVINDTVSLYEYLMNKVTSWHGTMQR